MPAAQIDFARERDFSDFVRFADDEELLSSAQLMRSELNVKFANVRSNVSDLMRERLAILDRTLGLI